MNASAIEITLFKKSHGVLSKTITAAADGSPISDGRACRMSSGEAKRLPLPGGAQALAEIIDSMASNEALSLGRLVPSVGEPAPVTTVSRLGCAPEGTIARSSDFLDKVVHAVETAEQSGFAATGWPDERGHEPTVYSLSPTGC